MLQLIPSITIGDTRVIFLSLHVWPMKLGMKKICFQFQTRISHNTSSNKAKEDGEPSCVTTSGGR